ncbi:MAG: HAD family hydrolase [Leptolyngbya sp. SIOISBB]|nr:HAD family hydrolase [Leptolyngbya sp. SIOISBB]
MNFLTVQCGKTCFPQIAAILWDKDGTLADSHGFLRELAHQRSHHLDQQVPGIYDDLMTAFGCVDGQYDPTGLMAVGTRYENEVAAAAYVVATGKAWTDSLKLAQTTFAECGRDFRHKADLTPPFSGIVALLRQASEMGLKQAVLSGDSTSNIQKFLTRYGMAPLIEWVAGSEAPPVKPDPQMVWTACEQLEVAPEHCLVIGDSGHDGELARRSDCRGFISVTWGGSPAIAGADAVLTEPQQLQFLP